MTTEPRQEALSIVNRLAVDARRVENWYYERVESRELLVDVLAAAIKADRAHINECEACEELERALSALREHRS